MRKILTTSVLSAALLALAGCGGEAPGAGAGETKSAGVDLSKPAELVFFSKSRNSEAAFNERFGNAIREKFPQYTIKYIVDENGQKMEQLLIAGDKFDIYWDSVGLFMDTLTNANLQYDLRELIKKNNVELNRIEPVMLDGTKQPGGEIYALPVINKNLVLFYNKDIFDKFGMAYPKDGMNWEETLELARKLTRTEDGVRYIGLGVSQQHQFMRLNQLSVPIIDPVKQQANTDNPKIKTLYNSLIAPIISQPGFKEIVNEKNTLFGSVASNTFYTQKNMAMLVYVSDFPFEQKGMAGVNWDMVSLPEMKEAPGLGSQAYPIYFTVTSTSKNKEQAMEVLKYLTSDDYQLSISKRGMLTVLKDGEIKKAFAQEASIKDKNFQAVYLRPHAPSAPKSKYDPKAELIYDKYMTELAKGAMDVNTALRITGEEVNKMIEAERASGK
jgi:multiple sugar transport system substrate-binding protein